MAEEKQQLDWDKIKKFSKQVSNDIGAAMLGALSYIGDRLGIFSALAEAGTVTSAQLAEKTGLSERYLREVMIPRLAPVSQQMILNFIAEKVLGLPKSY